MEGGREEEGGRESKVDQGGDAAASSVSKLASWIRFDTTLILGSKVS